MPTALIVEDEPEANRLLAMLIQLRGYATVSAFTGEEALELVQSRHPDIVFLDLMLPDINGYEVCKRLKTRKATSLIPVIMVTARVAAENRVESYRVGADDYVPKPYTPDQIFRALASATAWPGRPGGPTIEGSIPLEAAGEDEARRLIARFRNALVARSSLSLEEIGRIVGAVYEIVHDCVTWSRRSRKPLETSLGFIIEPEHLSMTLSDASGWLAESDHDPAGRWCSTGAGGAFDKVVIEEPGQRMTFTKWYQASDTLPSS